MVKVLKTEEKWSDVNLATHLLWDACRGDFDEAVVMSNDSDLAEPIRVVVQEFGKPVTVVNPHFRRQPTRLLLKVASSTLRQINRSALASSQFASPLTDAKGAFTKPAGW